MPAARHEQRSVLLSAKSSADVDRFVQKTREVVDEFKRAARAEIGLDPGPISGLNVTKAGHRAKRRFGLGLRRNRVAKPDSATAPDHSPPS